jgi:hypothetical protein
LVLPRAEQEIEFIIKNKIRTNYFADKDYPYRLKECPDAPIILYSKGNCELNNAKFIGIVGTRNATEYGKELCCKLIADIAQNMPNAVIVSGLAYGVDICAHKAALDAGLPTIGAIGHGLLAYPWLASEWKQGEILPVNERRTKLIGFHERLLDAYTSRLEGGEHQLLSKMQTLWDYLLPDADKKLRKKVLKSTTLPQYLQAVSALFATY